MPPETALDLWERGELHDRLNLPHDDRVEIIDGKIVVSSAPQFGHNFIAAEIAKHFYRAAPQDPSWEVITTNGVLFQQALAGYIPDLAIVETSIYEAAASARLKRLSADEIEMVVEVTTDGTAENDRPLPKKGGGKWEGYIRMEIPYYLLVDRDPKVCRTTLYSVPDPARRVHALNDSWEFGETIVLPEPFNLEIPTDRWFPWD